MILKIYLPIYLLLYLAVAFVIPTYRTWKSTGINPVTFGSSDTAHDYIGMVMKLLIVLLLAAVLCYTFNAQQCLNPIAFLQLSILQIIGLVLIHMSLLWISIAQYQMSDSWRIGIDTENKTALKTTGIFSVSRNPIFLGMIVSVFGIFLVVPDTLTFFLAFTGYFVIQIQIRLEEEFLEKQHGEAYRSYKHKVSRLI